MATSNVTSITRRPFLDDNSNPSHPRPICPIEARRIQANVCEDIMPVFEMVEPTKLLVDDSYQRNLSGRSMTLIRRIVSSWNWRHFKPPVVAPTELGLEIIDGQHTAIAAATHPSINEIPVMIVKAPERFDRAAAFIGQNKDRVQITPMQFHFAAVTAGNSDAMAINEVCEAAGVEILRYPPAHSEFGIGQSLAVKAIGKLIAERGERRATEVLKTLVAAECAPISAGGIKATDRLLYNEEFAGKISATAITNIFLKFGDRLDHEAKILATTHRIPIWRAMAIVIFQHRKHVDERREDAE